MNDKGSTTEGPDYDEDEPASPARDKRNEFAVKPSSPIRCSNFFRTSEFDVRISPIVSLPLRRYPGGFSTEPRADFRAARCARYELAFPQCRAWQEIHPPRPGPSP